MDTNAKTLAKKEAFLKNREERSQRAAQPRTHSPVPIKRRVKNLEEGTKPTPRTKSPQQDTKPTPRVKPRRELSAGPSNETPNKLQRDTSTGVLDEESKKKLVTNRPRSNRLPNLTYTKPSNHKLIKNAVN